MRVAAGTLLAAAMAFGGCKATGQYITTERLERGLVIILPGIEQAGPLAQGVRDGLAGGGMDLALNVHHWGRPIPLAGPLLNQMDVVGNRLAGLRVARLIADYQDSYPGRPVYLVGHSGGGGVAVFAAEALNGGRKVDGLILLSPSISSGYDLSKALARCRKGVANFYSKGDVGLLVVGTTVFGNVDGAHGPAAGAVGFDNSPSGLYQVPWRESMIKYGHDGGHAGSANSRFVSAYVVPWVQARKWPAY